MLTNSIRLFRVGGIDVGIHYSWLVIFALVTWSLAVGVFPQLVPGLADAEAWVLGVIAALLLFVSVLIHELAHSFVARARGLDARSITLFIFGGVSNLGGEAKVPATEFLVAVVGPITSFVIAGVSFVVAVAVPEVRIAAVASYLAFINLLLGAFNLIPGFPLDGGRVLRAIVWNATGSLRRATDIAANVGKLVAYGFLVLGFVRIFTAEDLIGGVWTAAIGWFLHNAASSSQMQVVLESRLANVRVGSVVRADQTAVLPDLPVSRLIEEFLLPGNRRAVPVVTDGRVVGMVTISDVLQVPVEARAWTTVGQVMGGRDGLVTVTPTDTLRRAFELLGEHDFEQLPVMAEGRLVGVLTRADVMRQLQLREALDVPADTRPGTRDAAAGRPAGL
jgi:Zn-dependent protease/CBS domain-containing protein